MGGLLRVHEGNAVRVGIRIEFKREIDVLVRRQLFGGGREGGAGRGGECVRL